jgi:hypothetical protein
MDDEDDAAGKPILEYRPRGSAVVRGADDLPLPAPVHQALALLSASLCCVMVPIIGGIAHSGVLFFLGLLFAPWIGLSLSVCGLLWVRRQPGLVWTFAGGILLNALFCLVSVGLWMHGMPC